MEYKQRTSQQNRALHKYFKQVADELNQAGYTVQLVLKEKMDLDWNEKSVKELLWKSSQEAHTGKKSTTELKKVEDIEAYLDSLPVIFLSELVVKIKDINNISDIEEKN